MPNIEKFNILFTSYNNRGDSHYIVHAHLLPLKEIHYVVYMSAYSAYG